ncbi:hypothetical protein [uncultured Cellulomonas sp.]|uniref:hypothetical protein n=1 Tax=uncultured Cellulomonas sp. TaxID=189682 RepID=UPI002619488E|nr:hypothetical protein [uncultured Cellulomonas sp.]
MSMVTDRGGAPGREGFVRLAYHYTDGREITTDAMPWAEALAYLPLLRAVAVGERSYTAPFATIELIDG